MSLSAVPGHLVSSVGHAVVPVSLSAKDVRSRLNASPSVLAAPTTVGMQQAFPRYDAACSNLVIPIAGAHVRCGPLLRTQLLEPLVRQVIAHSVLLVELILESLEARWLNLHLRGSTHMASSSGKA